MEAIMNILAEHGPTVLAIVGAIYTAVRTIVAATKTPIAAKTKQPDAQLMVDQKPVIGLIGKLLGIDLTQGRTENTVNYKTKNSGTKTLPMILACGFLFAGCQAITGTTIDADEIATTNQAPNVSEMTPDGLQRASYQGIGGTNAKVDADGEWFMTPGTGSMIAKDGVCVYLPGDMTAEGISYDGATFTADSLTISYSAPLKVQGEAVAVALVEISKMTQIEATLRIEQMKLAGEITATVADALLKYFVPTLPSLPTSLTPAIAP